MPVAPATISRDDEGRATVRAVRVTEPLRIDGVLDEAHYERVPGMSFPEAIRGSLGDRIQASLGGRERGGLAKGSFPLLEGSASLRFAFPARTRAPATASQ